MDIMSILPDVLLVALALVMLGLGLELTLRDFARVTQHKGAVILALVLQVILLPIACLLIVYGFALPAAFAVGMMILAASPGGVTANLFSHLYGGKVAMNISLTAINTVLAIVTLPLISNIAIAIFAPEGSDGAVVPLQFGKVAQVVAVVLVPVSIGMVTRRFAPALATRAQKPFKVFSALVLAGFALIAIVSERQALADSFATLGPAVIVFNLVSLLAGYHISRMRGLDEGSARAISFEIGIHNSTLALYIALSVLGNFQIALPAALYSVSMYVTAVLFGLWLTRKDKAQ
ncbi:bile acid:sodium symporter family protein [uncultured Pelagimonas sp.]|uniref:bile acid:sodium symporter family protein n=1 Tax=uncultured Pelagimonas sp. TaxID=1618102 RepID=UPI002636A3CD|nr:bile acid:sodium symporter family protein [uncultured Pelagimonas sp.]